MTIPCSIEQYVMTYYEGTMRKSMFLEGVSTKVLIQIWISYSSYYKEFGAVVWDATKEYIQKMNLTQDERADVNQWLLKKKDKLHKTILERLHGLHQIDPWKLHYG